LNTAMAGGSLDPKKLVSAVGGMDINVLLSDIRKLASDDCVVDEPYAPPVAQGGKHKDGVGDEASDKDESRVSFGIRAGINFSHTYSEYYDRYGNRRNGDYDDIFGIQAGFVVDFPVASWFHIQPGLMYVQKGMEDSDNSSVTSHYIELPLLLSFKLAALRLNAGPYIGFCVDDDGGTFNGGDIGLSTGVGFDIGMFYIGAFYGYGFKDVSNVPGSDFYNRTLGLNLGVNL